MDTARHAAYNLLLEIGDQLRNSSYERKIVEEKFVLNSLQRNSTDKSTVAVRDLVWTNLSEDWSVGLPWPTQKFAMMNLIPAVRYANMLWHWPTSTKRNERVAIKHLVDNKVLFRTEVTGIYLVNPLKLWKGNPIICVEATKDLIRSQGKPALDMIRDLRPGDRYTPRTEADQYNLLTDNSITPNLLEEPPSEYNE